MTNPTLTESQAEAIVEKLLTGDISKSEQQTLCSWVKTNPAHQDLLEQWCRARNLQTEKVLGKKTSWLRAILLPLLICTLLLGLLAGILVPVLGNVRRCAGRNVHYFDRYDEQEPSLRYNNSISRDDFNPWDEGRERYAAVYDNSFCSALQTPLSTFSVDVDTASYTNTRRFLEEGYLPNPWSIRIEEMLNYFSYNDASPGTIQSDEELGNRVPFAVTTQLATCPWQKGNLLLRIGIRSMELSTSTRPTSHIIFLLDVSGSMGSTDKLPLVKATMTQLASQMRACDRISIVTYASSTGVVLENASGLDDTRILAALNSLHAGGPTAGGTGIHHAYDLARKHYVPHGVNRIILCTDGDFNVGTTNTEELIDLVYQRANPTDGRGVYLSVCGFGTGNLNDDMMEKISNKGNGTYHYIDSLREGNKVFVRQLNSNLVAIAKDVKLQLEFNPTKVAQYRLIGYENRVLAKEDFNDDTVDAGDIGAGHNVTALYEIVPADRTQNLGNRSVDPLVYQADKRTRTNTATTTYSNQEWLTLKMRYKSPNSKATQGTSRRVTTTVTNTPVNFAQAHPDLRFAASVAAFGMCLRESPYKGTANLSWAHRTASRAITDDTDNEKKEFVKLIKRAQSLVR